MKSVVRPDLVGLSVGDDNLKDALVCELDHAPQSVLPLLLSDIAYDRDQKIVSLCLDEKDTLAFEVLKDGRVLDIVRNDLQKLDFNVRTICLFCGEQSKVYTEFSELRAPTPTNEPLPQSNSSTLDFSHLHRIIIRLLLRRHKMQLSKAAPKALSTVKLGELHFRIF